MKNKISLLKDCFSKETFDAKTDTDEMIISERNKISYVGMMALMCLLFVFGILADTFDINGISHCISMFIGIVNYGMLIAFCRKGIVKHHASLTAFIWSIITLPLSIVNMFLDKIIKGKIYVIVSPITIIVVAISLYVVCDFIYKKALNED